MSANMPLGSRNPWSEAGPSGGSGTLRLIVGVDFGTTFSGVSYVPTNMTARDVIVIDNWPAPGRFSDVNFKIPSRIAYAEENPGLATTSIGFKVTARMKSYTWFKLRLDRSAATAYDDPELPQSEGDGVLKLPRFKSATQICGDYMRELYQFTMKVLDQRLADLLTITPIEFWFTVPAIWSDAAKSATQQAARQAGFGSRQGDHINLISEPEAAAISALSRVTAGGSEVQIAPGDRVLICDCGGGTVDITTYHIKSVQPELDFEELLVGEGGKCGSTYIDRLFIQWMTMRFDEAFTNIPFGMRGPGSQFMQEFESYKTAFGFEDDATEEHRVTLIMEGVEADEHYDPDEGKVIFFDRDLEEWFRPAVETIQAMLGEQMRHSQMHGRQAINKILLVGGFGNSRYLLQRLRQWSQSYGGVMVICPDAPQTAVVRGAAIRGLGGIMVKSRKCRRHYGFQLDLPYDPMVDDARHKYTSQFNGKSYARGTMVWKVRKGEKIDENTFICQSVSKPWYKHETLVFKLPFYSCSADVPPRREEHPRVHKIGEVVVDLRNANLNRFKRRWKFRQDNYIYNLQYELQIMFAQREGVLLREGVLFVRAKNGNDIFGKAYIEYDTE